jgi:Protein of unknown function (DUF2786)
VAQQNIADSLLAKIRALLAKAEDPAATTAEAETYTAKATQLMSRYGIERAMLADADPGSDLIGEREILVDAPYARDKRGLLSAIGHALGCQMILRERHGRIYGALFGFGSDMDRVETLFTSLLVQAAHALAVTEVPLYENVAAFRRSWYAGYSQVIGWRLREAEARARANAASEHTHSSTGTSAALVLVGRKGQVEKAWTDHTAKLKKARPRRLSGGGHWDGVDAGRRADLGGNRVGAGRRAVN